MDGVKPPTFLTRDQLAFEQGAVFELEVSHASQNVLAHELTGLTREGPFKFKFSTTGTSLLVTTLFRVPDMPTAITLRQFATAGAANAAYAMIYLRVNGTRVFLLTQGHLGPNYGIGYPKAADPAPLQLIGEPSSVAGTNPAAGVEPDVTVPDGEYWEILHVEATLVTAAAAATRQVSLRFATKETLFPECPMAATQLISETRKYSWFVGATSIAAATSGKNSAPIPAGLILRPGEALGTLTTNLNAGDNWSALTIWYQIYYSQIS